MSAFSNSLNLLWTQRFGTFCLASLPSNIGTWAQKVAKPWLLLSLERRRSSWILTLVGNILADRADRRRVIATFQSIQMLYSWTVCIVICRT